MWNNVNGEYFYFTDNSVFVPTILNTNWCENSIFGKFLVCLLVACLSGSGTRVGRLIIERLVVQFPGSSALYADVSLGAILFPRRWWDLCGCLKAQNYSMLADTLRLQPPGSTQLFIEAVTPQTWSLNKWMSKNKTQKPPIKQLLSRGKLYIKTQTVFYQAVSTLLTNIMVGI